ncbi:MAG: hypothetical protein Q8O52_15440 [Sulfuritalea sp.]|nr:hypothetical protein [Sulfuritalea sp.]
MKRGFACVLCAALLASAQAEDTPQAGTPGPPVQTRPAPELKPKTLGYAFEQPELLIRQRLFGLAHGVSLLAAACLDLPEHSGPIQDAYAAWHARQGKAVGIVAHDLAIHYFGPRAGETSWQDLARALQLGDSIQPALREVSLQDACASLPAAIARPRYEFDKLLAETESSELAGDGRAFREQARSYDGRAE